jgi:hypothetical protein
MYRLKAHEELLESGFAKTPSDNYVHSHFDDLSQEMIDYASILEPAVIKTICESQFGRKFIDRFTYCTGHFIKRLPITVVK